MPDKNKKYCYLECYAMTAITTLHIYVKIFILTLSKIHIPEILNFLN